MDAGTVRIGDVEYSVRRIRSGGRTTVARLRGQTLTISVPSVLNADAADQSFALVLGQAVDRLTKSPPAVPRGVSCLRFADGQQIEAMGYVFVVRVTQGAALSSSARLAGRTVHVCLAAGLTATQVDEHVTDLARRAISRMVLPTVIKRVTELNARYFGFKVGRVTLKDTSTRWGSCSDAGNINLNFRLLFAPEPVRDSVIIHELAHLKHGNHGPRFWALVRSVMPDYDKQNAWLKANASRLGVTEDAGED